MLSAPVRVMRSLVLRSSFSLTPTPPWLPPLAMTLLDKPSRNTPKGIGHDPPGLPEVQCTKVKDFKFWGVWRSLVLFFALLQGWEGSVVLQYWKLDIGLYSTRQAQDHGAMSLALCVFSN